MNMPATHRLMPLAARMETLRLLLALGADQAALETAWWEQPVALISSLLFLIGIVKEIFAAGLATPGRLAEHITGWDEIEPALEPREPEVEPSRFVEEPDGTLLDRETGLLWTRGDNGRDSTWWASPARGRPAEWPSGSSRCWPRSSSCCWAGSSCPST